MPHTASLRPAGRLGRRVPGRRLSWRGWRLPRRTRRRAKRRPKSRRESNPARPGRGRGLPKPDARSACAEIFHRHAPHLRHRPGRRRLYGRAGRLFHGGPHRCHRSGGRRFSQSNDLPAIASRARNFPRGYRRSHRSLQRGDLQARTLSRSLRRRQRQNLGNL